MGAARVSIMAQTPEVASFTAWINNRLGSVNQPPMSHHLFEEPRESEGMMLSHLLFATRGESVKIKASQHPAMLRGNMKTVLDVWRTDPAISLNTVTADNLYNGDGTYVLAWIWQLIKRYDQSASGVSREEWVKRTLHLLNEGKHQEIGVQVNRVSNSVPAAQQVMAAPPPPPQMMAAPPPPPQMMNQAAPPPQMMNQGAPPPQMMNQGAQQQQMTVGDIGAGQGIQLQRQQIQIVLQQQMVSMVFNGQMQQVTLGRQMVTVFAPAQNLAFLQPGQPTQIMLEQQQVTVTVNGYAVQMMIQQMPITIVAQQAPQGQPVQVTLINQGQPVVLVIIQHVVQIIVMLPGQVVVMQQTMYNDINRIQGQYAQNTYVQQPGYGQQSGYGSYGGGHHGGKHKKKHSKKHKKK